MVGFVTKCRAAEWQEEESTRVCMYFTCVLCVGGDLLTLGPGVWVGGGGGGGQEEEEAVFIHGVKEEEEVVVVVFTRENRGGSAKQGGGGGGLY